MGLIRREELHWMAREEERTKAAAALARRKREEAEQEAMVGGDVGRHNRFWRIDSLNGSPTCPWPPVMCRPRPLLERRKTSPQKKR